MKRFLLSMALLLALCVPWTQVRADDLTVFDGTQTTAYAPVWGNYLDAYVKCHTIYPAASLSAMNGSEITSLKFYISSSASEAWTATVNVYLKEVTSPTFTSFASISDATCVYTGTLNGTGSTMTISFTNSYTYQGGNLLLAIETKNTGNYKNCYFYYGSATTTASAWGYDYDALSNITSAYGSASLIPKTTFSYDLPNPCTKPSALNVSNVGSTTVDASWTAGSTETSWQYVVVQGSASPDWSDAESVTTPSLQLTGLTPNKDYTLYVRSYCDETSQSNNVTASFHTLCAALTPENLGTIGFETSEGFTTGEGKLNGKNCWAAGNIESTSTSYIPYIYNYGAYQGSNCLYMNAYYEEGYWSSTEANGAYAVLPQLDFSTKTIDKYEVSFYAKKTSASSSYSDYNDTIWVGVMTDPSDISTFTTIGYALVNTTDWAEYEILLNSYMGNATYVALRANVNPNSTASYNYGSFYVDNLKISAIPPCQPVKTLTATATRTSVTANWTLKPGVTNCVGYEVKLSADSDPDATGITTQTISNPATLTYTFEHLDRTTTYYVHVRTNCGSTDGYGVWTTVSATTKSLDECIMVGDGTVSTSMPSSSYGSTYFQQIFTASELLAQGVSAGPIKGITFTWSATNYVSKNMTIWMGQTEKETFSSTTDWESSSVFSQYFYTSATTFTAGTTTYQFSTPFVWDGISNIIIASAINNGATSGFTSIGTNCGAARSCYMYKDNYQYGIDPTVTSENAYASTLTTRSNIAFCQTFEACPAVKNVTISDSTQTTANISWTAATGDYANDYDVLVSTTPVTDFSAVTPRHTGLTSTTDTLQGLSPYTDYYVYVRVNCNAHEHDDSLAWSEAAYFKTLSNCITPSNLDIQLRGKTTGMVTWTATTQDNNYRYILSTTEVADPDNAPVTADSIAADSVLLTGLTPETHYYFYLSNECGEPDGNSPYMLLEFNTPAACIEPENVAISDTMKYQMTLNWTASPYNDPTDSYDIIVSPTQVTEFEGVVPTYTGVTGTSKVLDSLQRNTTYYVYICTNCGDTTTNYTEVIAKTLDLAPACKEVTLESNTSQSNVPYSSCCKYGLSEQIYTPTEIGEAGTIDKLSFKVASQPKTSTLAIYMIHTNKSSFSSSTNWVTVSESDLVFSDQVTFTTGWNTITLQNSFEYNGKDNVMLIVDNNTGSYSCTMQFYKVDGTGNSAIYYNNDYNNPNPLSSVSVTGTTSSSRAAVKFNICGDNSPCPTLKNAPTYSNVTNTNATLTWNTGKGDWASTYTILYAKEAITDFANIPASADSVVNIPDTNYTFTTLAPNTTYYMYVRVNCKNSKYDDGISGWSPACNFTTELPCLRPTDFVAGNPTSYSVPLSWVEHNGATTWNVIRKKGEVYDTISVNASKCTIIGNDTVNYVDSTNIEPKTTYTYYLQTNCQADSLSKMAAQTPIVTTLNNVIGINNFHLYDVDVTEDIFIDTENNQISAGLRKGTDRSNISFNITYADYNCKGYVGDTALFQNSCNFSDVVEVYVYAEDTTIAPEVWYFDIYEEECASPYDFNVPEATIQRRSAVLNWKVNDNTATNFDFIISDTAVVNFEAWTAPQSITAENNEGNCTYALTGIYRDSTYYVYVRNNCGATTSQWRGGSFTTPGLTVCDNNIISNGSTSISGAPFYTYYLGSSYYVAKSQFIYPSDSLTAFRGKSISKMTFFTDRDQDFGTAKVEVRMGITSASLTALNSAYIDAPSSVVYTGNIVMSGNKWVIDFGENVFDYPVDGGNLLLQFLRTQAGNVNYTSMYYYGSINHEYGICRYTDYYENSVNFLPKVEFESCEESATCPDIDTLWTSDVQTNSIVLNWTPTTGDYPGTSEIFHSTTEVENPDTIAHPQITTINASVDTIKGLKAYTHYYIYLRTHCNGEGMEDGWTNWIMTDTITESACEYPRNVAATMNSKNTALLTWTDKEGQSTAGQNYEYVYSTVEGEPTGSGSSTTAGFVDMIDLSNSTTYYCYVRKVCEGEAGSSPWIKTTITTVPVMPAVINLAASDISYNAFRATWNMDHARFANETSWKYACVESGTTPTAWTTTSDTSAIIYGLSESTPYDLYLLPLDDQGTSGDTAMITVTTTAVPAPCQEFISGATNVTNAPMFSNYQGSYSVVIYTAEELVAQGYKAGEITSISCYQTGCGSTTDATKYKKTTTVWMKNTSKSAFSNTSDWEHGMTQVKNPASVDFNKVNDWVEITLDEPFIWNGDSNIAVGVLAYSSSYTTMSFRGGEASSSVSLSSYYDATNWTITDGVPSITNNLAYSGNRPNIQFCFVPESCTKPNHFVVDNITTSSARASWYPGSDDIAWEYYVSTEELTQDQLWVIWRGEGSEGTVMTMEPVVNLEDLTKDMDYYFYVSRECDDTTVFASTFFQTLPTCSAPITAQADNTGDNEITFDATFGQYGTVGTYDFWYWKVGSTDTIKVNGQTSQIVETNVPGGDYNWQVRANCGDVDGMSRWTAGNRVRVCGVYNLPYTQGFEDIPTDYSGPGMINPICWNDQRAALTNYGSPYYVATTDYKTEGSKSLKMYSTSYADSLFLIMPYFQNVTDCRVKFDGMVENRNYSGNILVGYMTTDSSFVPSYTLQPASGNSWKSATAYVRNIPAGARVAFCYSPARTTTTYYGYIDNIVVDTIPVYNVASAIAPADPVLGSLAMECAAIDTVSAGRFYENAKPVFTATPNYGMKFTNWTNGNNGDTINTVNPWTLTVTADTSIIANFDTASFNLNVNIASGSESLGTVSGSGNFKYLSENQITATANEHYHVIWNDGNRDAVRTITMPGKDTTLTATFAIDSFTVTTTQNVDSMGTISGAGSYPYAATATLEATPADHHHFVEWSNGEITPQINVEVVQDTNLHATFRLDTIYVTALSNDDNLGQVSGSGYHGYNRHVTLKAHPEPHYHLKNWSNGMTGDEITIYPTSDTTITAYFVIDTFTVTAVANPSATGTFTNTGKYPYGASVSVKAIANEHYHFVDWENGSTDTTQTFEMPAYDTTITANFRIDTVLITATPSQVDRGTIQINSIDTTTLWVDYGSQVTVEATAIYPYSFKKWDNDTLSNPYTFTAEGEKTLKAMLTYNEFVIAVNSNNESMGTVTGSATLSFGNIDTITATPKAHHHFIRWTGGSTDNPSYLAVTKDTSITGYFGIDSFTVIAVPNVPTMGTVTGGDIYPYNTPVTVTATPAAHHHFLGWSNGVAATSLNWNITEDSLVVANFAIDQHTVAVSANDAEMGSVTGSGTYNYGTQVTITATPANDHYAFDQWSNGDRNATTTIDLAGDTSVTAIFTADTHDVTLLMNGAGMGSVDGAGNYAHGAQATISATANDHYHFVDWSNGLTTATANIIVDDDTTITANFAIDQHNVSVIANDAAMGTVTGSGIYNYGASADLVATPAANHHFVGWDNNITTATQTVNVSSDSIIIATFAIDRHNITVSANDPTMGSVTGTGLYDYGTQVTITATPSDEHYSFVQWSNGDNTATTTITLTQDTAITAIFSADTHDVTLNVNDATMGSVAGSGNYAHGATAAISATPNAHYSFVNWSNGITTPTANIVVDRDTVITANFAVEQHSVTAQSNDPAKGSVTGSGTYSYGAIANLVATPAAHNHFVAWSDGFDNVSYSLNVASDTTVIATFAIDQHNVVATPNNPALGSVTGSGLYDYGTEVTLTATPLNAHSTFVNWSNGQTTPTISFTLTQDVNITAIFSVDSHLITVNSNNPSMGAVTGGGTYNHGATADLTATPNDHYHFLGWSNGMSTPNYSIVVDRDSVFTAMFAIDEHNVTAYSNNTAMGSVTGAGTYEYNTDATLVATPVAHHHFVDWSNGVTNATQIVRVVSDTDLVANFAVDEHNVTVKSSNLALGKVTGSGQYGYGSQVTITATPTANASFTGWSNGLINPTAVINLTKDTVITAYFVLNQYTLTVNSNDESMGTATGGGSYAYGDGPTLKATPASDCYRFVRWSDGSTVNPRKYTVTESKTITAIFAVNEHTLSVASNNPAAGTAYIDNNGTPTAKMRNIACGTLVDIYAVANEFYRFVDWSDGVTDAVRTIDLRTDSNLVARFEANCGDYADLPVQFLYNGLVMLDLDSVKARGYNPQANQVSWYQVVGDVDPLGAQFPADDKFICTGYYLSLPTNNLGYGQYYAVVDVSNSPEAICHDKMRTVVVDYFNDLNNVRVEMAPTNVKSGDIMTITGLIPEENTTIIVYDYTGKTIDILQTEGLSSYDIRANGAAGVYMVKVTSESVNETLRFIINK